MRADVIAQLAWFKPRSNKATRLNSSKPTHLDPDVASDIVHYVECHKDVAFGWNFATAMLDSHLGFPSFLKGDDLYVWRAYCYLKGCPDSDVQGALALTTPEMKNVKASIEALLVTDKITLQFIAEKLSINESVVRAYEKLFFNVLDRKADHAYLADIIYPETRMVEAMEDYLETTGIGQLMMRAGFAHGSQHVLYCAGLGKNPYANNSAIDGANALDSMFMADGCLYASMGWMHQRNNAMPITNARLSMQATKMANNNITAGTDMPSLGETFKAEIVTVGQYRSKNLSNILAADLEDK